MEKTVEHYTYEKGRLCKNCGKPIPDQAHGTIEFCPKEYLSNGSIKSCKDDYWAEKRKVEMEPFIKLAYQQRDYSYAIENLLNNVGKEVSVEDLNRAGINLKRAVEQQRSSNGLFTFYFIHYALEQISEKTFKIYHHAIIF